MEAKTQSRIGIVASIIGAVGAVVYLLRKPTGPVVVQGPAGAAGAPGITSAAAITGAAGGPGPAGTAGAAGAPGQPGPPGASGAASPNDVPGAYMGGSPSIGTLNEYFMSSFFAPPAGTPRSGVLTDNAPASSDLGKRFMSIFSNPKPDTGNGGCGGNAGGCGCGGKKCPNAAAPFKYPDGAGGCFSSTYGRLSSAMDKCSPNATGNQIDNVGRAFAYMGIAPSELPAAIEYAGRRSAPIIDWEGYTDLNAMGIVS